MLFIASYRQVLLLIFAFLLVPVVCYYYLAIHCRGIRLLWPVPCPE